MPKHQNLQKIANSNTSLPQERRETLNKQPNFIPNAIGKRRAKNPKSVERKKEMKIRAEMIEKEKRETMAKINKTKSWFFEKMNKIYRLIEKKGRRNKTIKLEVKTEKLQQTTQKYRRS